MDAMDSYLLEGQTATPLKLYDDPTIIRLFASPLGWRVLREFAQPCCPADAAKRLGVHEQKVYYYVTNFRKAGLLREVGREQRQGALARFYQLKDSAYGVRVGPGQGKTLDPPSPPLQPFVQTGRLQARIIVGSPDPHGPFKARAADGCCAIDLALFLGSLAGGKQLPNYRLDVELREAERQGNLIVIGGPTVNMVTHALNDNLPIRFSLQGEVFLRSTLSGREYREDEEGMVTVVPNPWDPEGRILLLAGKRFAGTRAAILALIHRPEIAREPNPSGEAIAHVVRGVDADGDGTVDTAEVLE
ncbi:MAG: hypothetical protein HY520_05125 [Candidatus Aenigmarchaeota archaeon]|nr:hypothetical protein [Candidatus Aenigmarchaeota archaeon]